MVKTVFRSLWALCAFAGFLTVLAGGCSNKANEVKGNREAPPQTRQMRTDKSGE